MKNIGVIYTLLRYQQGFYYRSFQFLRVHLTQIISSIIFDTQYRIPVKNEKPEYPPPGNLLSTVPFPKHPMLNL